MVPTSPKTRSTTIRRCRSTTWVNPTSVSARTGFGSYAAGGASAYFSDMLGNRSLGVSLLAQGTFKDIGGQVFYVNQEKRLNWGLSGGRVAYMYGFQFFDQAPNGNVSVNLLRQRIFLSQTSVMAAYPFSTTRRVETNVGVQRISFDTELETYIYDQFGRLIQRPERISQDSRDAVNLASVSVALVGDNSNAAFVSPVSGGRFRLEVGQAVGTVNFSNVVADFRRYLSPSNDITFAVRGLHFGRYGNNLDTNRTTAAIQPYFLGYETFIRGYSFESFEPEECDSSGGIAGTCPGFDRLFGHRLLVGNFEVRVPLLGTPRFGLLSFPYLPTEIFLFSDVGLAFNDLDEVNFEFVRSGDQRVPVFSTGFRSTHEHPRLPHPGGVLGASLPATAQGQSLGLLARAGVVDGLL